MNTEHDTDCQRTRLSPSGRHRIVRERVVSASGRLVTERDGKRIPLTPDATIDQRARVPAPQLTEDLLASQMRRVAERHAAERRVLIRRVVIAGLAAAAVLVGALWLAGVL